MKKSRDEFELFLKNVPLPYRMHLIEVLDTAEVCVSGGLE